MRVLRVDGGLSHGCGRMAALNSVAMTAWTRGGWTGDGLAVSFEDGCKAGVSSLCSGTGGNAVGVSTLVLVLGAQRWLSGPV